MDAYGRDWLSPSGRDQARPVARDALGGPGSHRAMALSSSALGLQSSHHPSISDAGATPWSARRAANARTAALQSLWQASRRPDHVLDSTTASPIERSTATGPNAAMARPSHPRDRSPMNVATSSTATSRVPVMSVGTARWLATSSKPSSRASCAMKPRSAAARTTNPWTSDVSPIRMRVRCGSRGAPGPETARSTRVGMSYPTPLRRSKETMRESNEYAIEMAAGHSRASLDRDREVPMG